MSVSATPEMLQRYEQIRIAINATRVDAGDPIPPFMFRSILGLK